MMTKSTLNFRLVVLGLLFFSFFACSEDDNSSPTPTPDPAPVPTPTLDSATYMATAVSLADVGNTATAEDLEVSFKLPSAIDSISLVKVFIVRASSLAATSIASLGAVDEAAFTEVGDFSTDPTFTFAPEKLDTDGEVITDEIEYVALVMTEGAFMGETVSLLSNPSESLQLEQQIYVTTLATDFNGNDGVSIDTEGNVYCSGFSGGTGQFVYKVSPSGEVTEFANGLLGPLGHAFDSQGNLFVVSDNDNTQGSVYRIGLDNGSTLVGTLSGYPAGVAIDQNDNVYVSNYLEGKIDLIAPDGTISTFLEDPALAGGVGIAFTEDERIVLGNFINGEIVLIGNDQEIEVIAQLPTVVTGWVIGYITYLNGHVYATAIGENKIYRIGLDGEVTHFAGNGAASSQDGELLDASFQNPNGIEADPTTNSLYISEYRAQGPGVLRVIQLP